MLRASRIVQLPQLRELLHDPHPILKHDIRRMLRIPQVDEPREGIHLRY